MVRVGCFPVAVSWVASRPAAGVAVGRRVGFPRARRSIFLRILWLHTLMAWIRIAPVGACGVLNVVGTWHAACDAAGRNATDDAELQLVQVLFRHGARTPLTEKYWTGIRWERGTECRAAYEAVTLALTAPDGGPPPTSKYDQRQMSTIWPGGCSKGELTVGGQEQSRDLGSWLRKRYIDQLGLLPANYSEGSLAARTTNYARTRATLAGVLTGLYPNTAQPIPALTSEDAEEILIGTAHSCRQLGSLLRLQASRLRDAGKTDSALQQLDSRVRKALELEPEHRIAYTDLYDALTTLKFHGKGWQEGVSEQLYRDVEEEALRRMAAIVSPRSTDDLGLDIMSLSVGQLLAQMSTEMEGRVSGSGEGRPRLFLFSGHDTTVMPVLSSLIGDRMDRWPGYLSNVVIELWKRKNAGNGEDAFFVRALYNQEEIQLEGASPGQPLSYSDFKARFWHRYRLERPAYLEQCELEMRHDAPAPQVSGIGGDSVQGL